MRAPTLLPYRGNPKVAHRPHVVDVARYARHRVMVRLGLTDALGTTYDAVTPGNLPAGGDGYLGYVDGNFASNAGQVRARFPGALVKTIAVNEHDLDADIFDTEPGNPDAWAAARWVVAKAAAGKGRGTVYYGNWQAGYTRADVQNALVTLGVSPEACDWFLANYDGLAVLPPGHVGKQYRGNVPPGFDVSCVSLAWLRGTAPAPTPPPAPTPTPIEEDIMAGLSQQPWVEKFRPGQRDSAAVGGPFELCFHVFEQAQKGKGPLRLQEPLPFHVGTQEPIVAEPTTELVGSILTIRALGKSGLEHVWTQGPTGDGFGHEVCGALPPAKLAG